MQDRLGRAAKVNTRAPTRVAAADRADQKARMRIRDSDGEFQRWGFHVRHLWCARLVALETRYTIP